MAWHELALVGLRRSLLPPTSKRLFAAGAAGLQEDHLPGQAPAPQQPWDTGPPPKPTLRMVVRAWFEDADQDAITASLTDLEATVVWSPVDEVDWETQWRVHFKPIRISDRLTIAPPWDAPEGALVIEPGQGFGTGAHPTTRMALAEVDRLSDGLQTTIDVGCGSGILAIAAARLGLQAVGIDVEEPAIRDAIANADTNGVVCDFSTTMASDLPGAAELVLGNLHAELIVMLADDLIRLTGNYLVLAGILAEREHKVRTVMDPALALVQRVQDGEWVGLTYQVRP